MEISVVYNFFNRMQLIIFFVLVCLHFFFVGGVLFFFVRFLFLIFQLFSEGIRLLCKSTSLGQHCSL